MTFDVALYVFCNKNCFLLNKLAKVELVTLKDLTCTHAPETGVGITERFRNIRIKCYVFSRDKNKLFSLISWNVGIKLIG